MIRTLTLLRILTVALALLVALPVTARAGALPRVPVVPGIDVIYGPCPSTEAYYLASAGCTWVGASAVYVFNAGDTWTIYHELGHQFAFRVFGDTDLAVLAGGMRKFARLTAGDGPRRYFDVREEFADAYRACAVGIRPEPTEWGDRDANFPTGSGYNPTPRVHRMVCAMIVRAGARGGLPVP